MYMCIFRIRRSDQQKRLKKTNGGRCPSESRNAEKNKNNRYYVFKVIIVNLIATKSKNMFKSLIIANYYQVYKRFIIEKDRMIIYFRFYYWIYKIPVKT